MGADDFQIVVKDAEEFRPKELPLLITPPEGKDWLNPEQAAYAKVLNAAAYANHGWKKNQVDSESGKEMPNSAPKDVELKRLAEIGTNPSKYYDYTGEPRGEKSNVEYKNKLVDQS